MVRHLGEKCFSYVSRKEGRTSRGTKEQNIFCTRSLMIVDESLRSHVLATFGPLGELTADYTPPEPRTLSIFLEPLVPEGAAASKDIDAKSASFFATAAVDIWLRGVHSFLVSASLSETSPIWASVT